MPSLVEKYSSLLEDLKMSDQEAEDVAGFVADVTEAKLAGDDEAASRALYCYLATLPGEAQVKLAKMVQYIDEEGGELEKNANIMKWFKGMGPVGKGLMAGGLGVGVPAAVGGVLQLAGKALDKAMADRGGKVLETATQKFPDLQGDMGQTVANYATIQKFAPTLASDPNAVGGLLSNLQQLGPGAMTYQTLQNLAKMEADVQKARKDRSGFFSTLAEGASGAMGGAGSALTRGMMGV